MILKLSGARVAMMETVNHLDVKHLDNVLSHVKVHRSGTNILRNNNNQVFKSNLLTKFYCWNTAEIVYAAHNE